MWQTVVTRRQVVHKYDRQQRHLFWWQILCTLLIGCLQHRPSSALLRCCHGSAVPHSELVTFQLMANCLVMFKHNRTPLWADITAIKGRQKCQKKNSTFVARSKNHETFWKWKSFKARKEKHTLTPSTLLQSTGRYEILNNDGKISTFPFGRRDELGPTRVSFG